MSDGSSSHTRCLELFGHRSTTKRIATFSARPASMRSLWVSEMHAFAGRVHVTRYCGLWNHCASPSWRRLCLAASSVSFSSPSPSRSSITLWLPAALNPSQRP